MLDYDIIAPGLTDAELVAQGRKAKQLGQDEAYKALGAEAMHRKLRSCDGCNGDGVHRSAGRVENGKFIGHEGTCFRCGGKGFQNEADRRRNWGYDQHRRVYA